MSGPASSVVLTIATGGASQAIGTAVEPVVEAGKGVCNCLERKYKYIKNLKRNYENLELAERYLSSRETDVKEKIADRKATEKATHECTTWLEHVTRETEKVQKLKTEYQTLVNGSCGACLLHTRLKLSKKIVDMTNSVKDVYNQIDPHRGVLVERRLDRVPHKYPNNVLKVPSLHQHVETILEYFKDKSIKRIGIWGVFGVGKTTILLSLKEQVEERHIFDIVLHVTVPNTDYDPCKVRSKILEQLSIPIENQSQAEELISRTLENKKYLLLLDQISSCIDLYDIGFRDSHKCKVVLATRERENCRSMETDEEIKVEKLSEVDAQKLFHHIVGEEFNRPPFNQIAERLLKQCGNLPRIIKAVGNQLKGEQNEDYWWEILSRLQSPIMFKLKHLEDVFNAFLEIYGKLDDNSKKCLLYAASFPNDHEIYRDHLIECWKVEQLVRNHKTFRRARQEGLVSLQTFIEELLIDSCECSNFVKMPIIFRNAALRLADQQNYKLLVKDIQEMENPPPIELWTNAEVVSLMNSGLHELPDHGPNCAMISTVCLRKNEKLLGIPSSFFDHMSTLKLLDLSGTGIRSLPSSISHLANLKGLYLNDCNKLVDLPHEMEQLQKLELLDICRTGIHGFQAVIGALSHLTCLRASFTTVVNHQNCGEAIIGQLLHLEELTIDADPENSESEWNKNHMIATDIAAQVAKLEKLSTLSFYFPSTETLETFTKKSIPWIKGNSQSDNNSMSFNIYVYSGTTNKFPVFDVYECSGKRYLRYSGGKDKDIPAVIKEVLSRSRAFELFSHEGIKDFSEFGIDNTNNLEVCRIEGCNAMVALLGSQVHTEPAFPCLKELHLCQLHRLTTICQGPITNGSFVRLKTLVVDDIPGLMVVLSWEMSKQLIELEYLKVKNCRKVEEIIAANNQSGEIGEFQKLKTLELDELGELHTIHTNDSFKWCELEKVKIKMCEKLSKLCLSTTNATKLRRIECSKTWWETTGRLEDQVKANLQDFCHFTH